MADEPFYSLLLITALALVVPYLASKLRRVQVPIVVGEILAGIIVGKSGLDLIEPSETLLFLAEFGFAFLMFLSGLEIDFPLLLSPLGEDRERGFFARPVPLAALLFTLTLGLSLGAAFIFAAQGWVSNPYLMALILSTTSLGVVVPVLKEKGHLGSSYGQMLLIVASISDLAGLILLSIAIALMRKGLTVDLLLLPAMLTLFVLFARLGHRFAAIKRFQEVLDDLSHATSQFRVRGALALMVAWVVLALAFGVELILGAFLAGAIASLITRNDDFSSRERLDALGYGFFIPIFFILVGAELDLAALAASPQALVLVPVLLVVAYVVKLVPSLLLRIRFTWREAIGGGLLISSRLSLIIAAAAIALSLGAISQATNSAAVLLAVVSCTLSPLLFNRLISRPQAEARRGVIIVGTGQMAPLLARRLSVYRDDVFLITSKEAAVEEPSLDPGKVIEVDWVDASTLARAHAATADGLISLSTDPVLTESICRMARERFGIPKVIARVGDVGEARSLQTIGVRVVQPAMATVMALEGALRYPTAFDVLVNQEDDVEVRERELSNPALSERSLRSVNLPGNTLVLSLRREGTVLVPDGDTILRMGDCIALVGSPDSLEEALTLLAG